MRTDQFYNIYKEKKSINTLEENSNNLHSHCPQAIGALTTTRLPTFIFLPLLPTLSTIPIPFNKRFYCIKKRAIHIEKFTFMANDIF
jgi:hypothetical protein